jgi:hypothetical protein
MWHIYTAECQSTIRRIKPCDLQENNGTENHIKQNKPDSERQISHAFSYMKNLYLLKDMNIEG